MNEYTSASITKGSDVDEFLRELVEEEPVIENYSHAARYCIREYMQSEPKDQ